MTGYVSEIFSSFQGEGLFAGRRHVFLRMGGCNLRCGYCDTPGSLERTASCSVQGAAGGEQTVKNPLDVASVVSLLEPLLSAQGVHALAITGGEPLLQSEFIAELLDANEPPVPVLLETNGTYPRRLEAVLPFIDIVSMDLKLPTNSGEPPFWEEHRAFLAATKGKTGKTVYVKVPVDEATSEREVTTAARLVAAHDRSTTVFLQPILSPSAEVQISPTRLARFYDLATAHLDDVRVLPQAHRFLGVR